MLASNIPVKVPLPFANSGTKNAIPTASQIGIIAGKASLTDGFPPLTFTPLASGGVPPAGADFNGILNLLSANTQWANAGGAAKYDASFSASIGGYPKGANLVKATNDGYWLNTVDGNTTNPDTGGAGWDAFVSLAQFTSSNQSLTTNGYQKLPGGIIVQWGTYSAGAGTSGVTISLPVAFPNAFLCLSATHLAPKGNSNIYAMAAIQNGLGALDVTCSGVLGVASWLAIGK